MRSKKDQTRRQIIDAAYDSFWRAGFARTSIDSIAARAGVTKRTVYSYFRSKDDLLAAVLNWYGELAMERLRRIGRRLPAERDGMIELVFRSIGRMGQRDAALVRVRIYPAGHGACRSAWSPGSCHCAPRKGDD